MKEKGGLSGLIEGHHITITIVVRCELIGKNDQVLTLELVKDRSCVLVCLKVCDAQGIVQMFAQVSRQPHSHLIVNVGDGSLRSR